MLKKSAVVLFDDDVFEDTPRGAAREEEEKDDSSSDDDSSDDDLGESSGGWSWKEDAVGGAKRAVPVPDNEALPFSTTRNGIEGEGRSGGKRFEKNAEEERLRRRRFGRGRSTRNRSDWCNGIPDTSRERNGY